MDASGEDSAEVEKNLSKNDSPLQGDQIVRIFAHRLMVSFRQFFQLEKLHKFLIYFLPR
jgi:hypothetical protein